MPVRHGTVIKCIVKTENAFQTKYTVIKGIVINSKCLSDKVQLLKG